MRAVLGTLVLSVVAACGPLRATDGPGDLALMAGEWVAESSVRSGQQPAPAEALAKLTLKIEKDQWVQSFGKDVASFTITLDPAQKTMAMKHNTSGLVLDTTYVLKGDKLTVTRVIDRQPLDIEVKVWRWKGPRG